MAGPVRAMFLAGLALLALPSCGAPSSTEHLAAGSGATAPAATARTRCLDTEAYYAAAPETRIWSNGDGLTARGRQLVEVISGAHAIGVQAVQPAGTSERALSDAFVRLAAALSASPPSAGMRYVDDELRPRPPCPSDLLDAAARSPSLEPVLQRLRAPNLLAERLAAALHTERDPIARRSLADDLALAGSLGGMRRAIVVDSTAAQLWAIEGRRVAESMKVIVGKPGSDTPTLAALLRYAKINPYWDIPPDLVSRDIAPRVLTGGQSFLDSRAYEVVHAYGPAPQRLDAAAVDWKAVQDGALRVGVRQRPSPTNTMGRVLFMFPNTLGIYLHDTPARQLFARADRRLSNGCVRVERAGALYRWAFGHELPSAEAEPDSRVDIAEPLPVFLVRFSPAGAAALAGVAAA